MQYCVLANHYWFLVEALYLHKLLLGAVFSEKNHYRLYLYLGWGRGRPGERRGWGQRPGAMSAGAQTGPGRGRAGGSADPRRPGGVPVVSPAPGLAAELRWVLGFTGCAV